jgi:hypothetical protein
MKKSSQKYIAILILVIALFSFLVSIISDYIVELVNPSLFGRVMLNLVFSLFLGALIAIGISIFTPVFREAMATLRRLLRVESLSNPLILKLSSSAPGTYHHSLNVSNLAQKAAQTIKADSLLVRTAAYYHDLGKLENPTLYVENQSEVEVPTSEDAGSIQKHANSIIAHVQKGVERAYEANLPTEIIDLIKEHHGTTRALYFYGIAKQKGLKIKKTDFRYEGPTPQSKESAILMLADCVEAAARATHDLTQEKINEIVDNTAKDRLDDNQFKNSGLSASELTKVCSSLKSTLRTIYHQRIEYKKH